jgi:beta-fructofuranosidase
LASVPEFLLRKLFVQGSLKRFPDGFSFQLSDNLMAVTITGISVSVDEQIIAPENLFQQFSGQEERCSSTISETSPVPLPMNLALTLRVQQFYLQPKKLRIEAQTGEMGLLGFSIDLNEKKAGPFTRIIQKVSEAVKFSLLVKQVRRDPHHPIYHFTPPANWMNDPNGLVSWQGMTHLFYQYNPTIPVWGTLHWGHAVSQDLVHWQHLPIAMSPKPGTPDADGCWSGSALMTDDGPIFFYTAVFPETVCMARPDAALRRLNPVSENPLIAAPPPGLAVEGFRDPGVWKEGEKWYLTLGSGIKGVGGAVLLYESTDLYHWNYLHPLLVGDLHQTMPFATGFNWECPQLFELNGEYFLFISAIVTPGLHYTFYFQGEMQDHFFTPKSLHFMDYGCREFYAPLSFVDDQNRRVMFGWLLEERDEAANRQAGWAGVLSLPRLLRLSPQGTLLVDPVPEVERLRKRLLTTFSGGLNETVVALSGETPVSHIELLAQLQPAHEGQLVISLAESPRAAEQTLITCDFEKGVLSVDTRVSSLNPLAHGDLKEAPLDNLQGEPLELRLFLDGSVLEVYANHTVVISSRLYPTNMKGLRLFICAKNNHFKVEKLQIWELGSCCA